MREAILKEIGGWLRKNDESPNPCSCNRYITEMLLSLKGFVERQSQPPTEASELVKEARECAGPGQVFNSRFVMKLADALNHQEERAAAYESLWEASEAKAAGMATQLKSLADAAFDMSRKAVDEEDEMNRHGRLNDECAKAFEVLEAR